MPPKPPTRHEIGGGVPKADVQPASPQGRTNQQRQRRVKGRAGSVLAGNVQFAVIRRVRVLTGQQMVGPVALSAVNVESGVRCRDGGRETQDRPRNEDQRHLRYE